LLDDTSGHEHLPELSQQEYSFFVNSVQRRAGESLERALFDVEIFKDSLFKVVSETDFDGPVFGPNAFFTEKTWKCVINHLPFIMAGNYYYLEYLENLGFETFQQYLKIKNFDDPGQSDYLQGLQIPIPDWKEFYQTIKDPDWPDCPTQQHVTTLPDWIQKEIANQHQSPTVLTDVESRLLAIVTNTEHWLETLIQHKDAVNQAVEHNFYNLEQLAKRSILDYETWAQQHGINVTVDQLIYNPAVSNTTKIRKFL
jgi:hypothetical protein